MGRCSSRSDGRPRRRSPPPTPIRLLPVRTRARTCRRRRRGGGCWPPHLRRGVGRCRGRRPPPAYRRGRVSRRPRRRARRGDRAACATRAPARATAARHLQAPRPLGQHGQPFVKPPRHRRPTRGARHQDVRHFVVQHVFERVVGICGRACGKQDDEVLVERRESGDRRWRLTRQWRAFRRQDDANGISRVVEPDEPHHPAKPARVERLEAGARGRQLLGRFDVQLRDVTTATLQELPLRNRVNYSESAASAHK